MQCNHQRRRLQSLGKQSDDSSPNDWPVKQRILRNFPGKSRSHKRKRYAVNFARRHAAAVRGVKLSLEYPLYHFEKSG
jgi:hypothetical protein